MANAISLVTKFLPLLDEQYRMEAKSSILDVSPQFVQETKDAKKIKIATLSVDGLASYDRNAGFVVGSADLVWVEYEFTQDRGRSIQIDDLDNEETFGLAFGRLAGEFQRTHVIPEIDAYRFAKYYTNAGKKAVVNPTASSILKFIDDADAYMDDKEVPAENRLLFVNPNVYNFMINDTTISKKLEVTSMPGNISKKITSYNEHTIIKVPSKRFYTAITLKTGAEGQTEGGYVAADGSSVIGMLMIHPSAVLQSSKRRISRVWAPTKEQAAGTDGVNPYADAWKFDYRIYHDAWTLSNKLDGVYGALTTPEFDVSVESGVDTSEAGRANDALIDSMVLEGDTVTITADVASMTAFASSVEAQGTHKWLCMVVNTGEASILGVYYGSYAFTATDVAESLAVEGGDGTFVLYLKADEIVNPTTPKIFTLTKVGRTARTITVQAVQN